METIPDHLVDRFSHHPPKTGERISRHEAVREASMILAAVFEELLPTSREAALAQTAVQSASLWANAALAIHESAYTDAEVVAGPAADAAI